MLESFEGLAFEFITVYQVVHAFIADELATCHGEGLQVVAHPDFDHQSIVDFLAGIERDVQCGQGLERMLDDTFEVICFEIRQRS